MSFDWTTRAAGNARAKESFHATARARLRQLAQELGFEKGSYDIRSNKGGMAVSGEVILHHDRVYVQVSQPATGSANGILYRNCEGRKDYTGGPNHQTRTEMLDDIPGLARKLKIIMPEFRLDTFLDTLSDAENDEYYRRRPL